MSFWKRKKYCKYCGSELKSDGTCLNKDCIAYVAPKTTDTTASDANTTAQPDTNGGT
ncbi:hypothetical protein [uncultured Megasphaera sp.]|uniref:hypothetical protein n=1 Tax=uncultured Megasphaera sp. TaxID=165188 RepID=UPI00204CE433|nr:hypothetical protein [uncultured Megasphaera sp.]DAJ01661.1 MAG TPA: NADH-PPase NADH pyrophosphatase zinc ribbon domain [Caudoviricetes sp.]